MTIDILFVDPYDLFGFKYVLKGICTANRNFCFLNRHLENGKSVEPQQDFRAQCPSMKNIFCESVQLGYNSLGSTELFGLQ